MNQNVRDVRGIAFDLEGTIVDLEALHHAAHLKAAADAGIRLSWEEALAKLPHFVGGPDDVLAAEMADLGPPGTSAEKILSAKRLYFHESLREHGEITVRDGFREFVAWLRQRGLQIAIGTATHREFAFHLLEKAGLLAEFGAERVVTREDVPSPKPAPDVYHETARRMRIETANQLVFEDSPVGLRAAAACGSRSVAMPTVCAPEFLAVLRREGAEAVFTGWKDPGLRPFVSHLACP